MNFMPNRATLVLIFLISTLKADIIISGTIKDSKSGEPVPMVNIFDEISETGTTSNEKGFFTLSVIDQSRLDVSVKHIAYNNHFQIFNNSDTSISILMEETLLQMNDVVVTSTRTGYLLRDVPIATEVISSKEINESGAITVGELISQRAGVSKSVNVDGGAIFNLLGLDSRYILVLKNNQPITGKFNNRVDLDQISTNRIKKIEIIKGPGSAVYGTEAMGGVINIITDDKSKTKGINLSYRGSSFGSKASEISNEPINSAMNTSISLPLKTVTISNDLTYQHFKKGQQFEYISADQIDKLNLNTKIAWENPKHKLDLSHQYFGQEDEGSTKLSSGIILYTNSTAITRDQAALTHSWYIKENTSISQTLRKETYKRQYKVINSEGLIERDDITKEDNTEYELLINKRINNTMINSGLEFSRPKYISDRILGGSQTKDIIGIFNQIAWNFLNTDIISGIRLDKYGSTKTFSPRVALAYRPKNLLTYRISYGHGFREPSFMESLIDWEHIQFGYTVKGNSTLKPEISQGFTLGAEYTNKNNFQSSAMVYHNTFTDLIKDYALEPGILSYKNIDKAYFTGIELITKWVINNSLTSSFTANYVKNEDANGNQIPNTIPLSIGSRLSYNPGNRKFLIALNLKGIGKYSPQEYDPLSGGYVSSANAIEPYLLGDLNIIYSINPKFKILIGSKNIGDHTNMSYGPYIGRTAYIEINTNIERQ